MITSTKPPPNIKDFDVSEQNVNADKAAAPTLAQEEEHKKLLGENPISGKRYIILAQLESNN